MRVVTTVALGDKYLSSLKSEFPNVEFVSYAKMEEALKEQLIDRAEVLVTFGKDLDQQLLNRLEGLKWAQVFSAGLEDLPWEGIKAKGVLITNVRGIHKIQMAEYTLAMMLSLNRNSRLLSRNQNQKKWDPLVFQGEIYQKTLGVIGAGSIGQEICKKAKALEMYTLGLNTTGREVLYIDEVFPRQDLEKLLRASDFVVVITPLTPETYHLIGETEFKMMKKSAYFINIARGQVVDEAALIEALRKQWIKGAGLDVFEEEPLPPDSPLWEMDNVIITPHLAGRSAHYTKRALEVFRKNLQVYLDQGDNYLNQIDIDRKY